MDRRRTKPPARRIDSGDCEIVVNGETYYPHVGEWVELHVGMSIGELKAIDKVRQLGTALNAVAGEPDEAAKKLALLNEHFDVLIDALSWRIAAWNWTDNLGNPLPQPDGGRDVLEHLQVEELHWLLLAVQGETEAQQKKDLSDSPIISLAIDLPPMAVSSSTSESSPGRV